MNLRMLHVERDCYRVVANIAIPQIPFLYQDIAPSPTILPKYGSRHFCTGDFARGSRSMRLFEDLPAAHVMCGS